MGPDLFCIAPEETVAQVLGARVRLIRQARGLSQSQLAEVVGMQRSWLSKLEAGRLSPSPGRLRALCQVLAVNPSLLLAL